MKKQTMHQVDRTHQNITRPMVYVLHFEIKTRVNQMLSQSCQFDVNTGDDDVVITIDVGSSRDLNDWKSETSIADSSLSFSIHESLIFVW
ncbi:hypothetical protein L1987_71723 [Smallanthus sonchifolius]|uniref:Uncharacterized protein n=1 Tax=Smallanthus sonchifolius TaxID=185202 RepID=A0ACB9AT83_9ASTR|nr:hypothetical protein L1987_71723 [Smallanthus sonchifolius]